MRTKSKPLSNGRVTPEMLPESLPAIGETIRVELPEYVEHELRVVLVGTAPLVQHRKGAKMEKQLRQKQRQEAKEGRAKKNPVEDFLDAIVLIDQRERSHLIAVDGDGKRVTDYDGEYENPIDVFAKIDLKGGGSGFGFPTAAFREALITAGGTTETNFKTEMRRTLTVPEEFVSIQSVTPPRMRFDHAPVQGGADLRFRPQYDGWKMELRVWYCPKLISDAQVLGLVRYAGRHIGFCEMRPEKKVGSFGTFTFDVNNVQIKRIA